MEEAEPELGIPIPDFLLEVQRESSELTAVERDHLKQLFRVPAFRKVCSMLAEEMNGAAGQILLMDPNNAVEIARIQGKVMGWTRLLELMEEEGYKDDREDKHDGRVAADLG